MRNYTQEQKLQLQTLISQEAMLPAKLFKYLRSEEHLPSLLALVDVPRLFGAPDVLRPRQSGGPVE